MQLKATSPIQSTVTDLLVQTTDKKSIKISTSNNMATLTQPVHNNTTTFAPINNSLDDASAIINAKVSVSKMKSQQSTVSNHIVVPPLKTSTSTNNNVNNTQRMNGTTSPKPHTTSQNKPPKIKLLNRSVNVASPVPEINGLEDESLAENDELPSENKSVTVTKDNCILINEDNETPTLETSIDSSADKEKQTDQPSKDDSTPPHVDSMSIRHVTPQHQYSAEYSSSPSSTSSSLNRENSLDYKDSTGVDLHDFMVKTLKENPRDRLMLLKLEKDFTEFINDKQKTCYKYQQMTSYHRMLVHRVAAYFGLDHNVDSTGKAVVISKTPSSRSPEIRFQAYCSREYTDEEISAAPKAILLRSTSSDDTGAGTPPNYDYGDQRFYLEDKKSKSFEEREEEYIKAKDRIFNKESCDSPEQSSTSSTTIYSPAPSSRNQDNSPSLSEREAAIATVAAKTGGKPGSGSSTKRGDRKNIPDLQLPPTHQSSYWVSDNSGTPTEQYSYAGGVSGSGGYPSGSSHIIRGQPINPADGNQMYYHPGYQPSTQIPYMPTAANGGYVQQPHQHPQQQQGQYMPVYYVSGGTPGVTAQGVGAAAASNGAVPQQAPQQYYMQQLPSGQIVYVSRQTAVNESTTPTQVLNSPQQQQIQYQDFNNQMASMSQSSMSLDEHHQQQQQNIVRNETDKQSSQVTSPTSPVEVSPAQTPANDYATHQRKQLVYFPGSQIPQGTQQYHPATGYPIQVYQNTFPGYQDASHFPSNSSQPPTPTSLQPPQSPGGIMPQQYPTVVPGNTLQSPVVAQSPQHMQAQAVAQQMNSSRPRFVSGILPYRANTPVYVPVAAAANPQQVTMTMLVGGQYSNVQLGAKTYQMQNAYRPTSKGSMNLGAVPTGNIVDSTAEYGKLDSQAYALQPQQQQQQQYHLNRQQNLVALNQQQHRPLMQFQPAYQQYVTTQYMSQQPKRFMQRQVFSNQLIRANANVTHKKYRPHRNVSGNQQIRISRPNSISSDVDQNTVSHILEVYDFPDTVASDNDAIFEDVRSSGARILKINSSSQSMNSAHSQQSVPQRPTILAIFKSAAEAQSALETVKNLFYKLRVSKKSPTHLSGSEYYPSSASSSPSSSNHVQQPNNKTG